MLGEFGVTRLLILGLVWEPKWSLGNRGYNASKPYEIGVIETAL